MKLTKSKLQQIIKEELMNILEGGGLIGKIVGKWTIVGGTDKAGKDAGLIAKHNSGNFKIPLTQINPPSDTKITISNDTSNTVFDPTTPDGEKRLIAALDRLTQAVK